MNIRKIALSNFMAWDSKVLEFPNTGVLLVTGKNGKGKSSWSEAVSWAFWGKTVRGTNPWRQDGSPCVARVFTDTLWVSRERKGSKTTLTWALNDHEPDTYESMTEAQNALIEVVGSRNAWVKTSVFSSHDADTFAMATDSERKRLLEELLDLGKFDEALLRCREELRALEADIDADTATLSSLEGRLDLLNEHLAEAEEQAGDLHDITALKATAAKFAGFVADTKVDIAQLRTERREHDRAIAGARAVAVHRDEDMDEFDGGACRTCGQDIPKDMMEGLQEAVQKAKDALDATIEAHEEDLAIAADSLKELQDDLVDLQARHTDALGDWREANTENTARRNANRILDTTNDKVEETGEELDATSERIEAATADVSVTQEAEKVLGLGGFRSHLLAHALIGIQAVAQTWLQKLSRGEYSLSLKPYTTRASGKVAASISLEVEGVGEGQGYKAASGGERRRIDIALLLGLADMVEKQTQRSAGTLFFDEVADALDEEGLEEAVDTITTLSTSRCMVVITHSKPLVDSFQQAHRLDV